jgi:hypothetical protein
MNIFKIPFSASNQKFNISLGGVTYTIISVWNGEAPAWFIDVINTATQEFVITSLPLVTGVNLLMQFQYTGIKGVLLAYTNGEPTQPPTFTNLGAESNVYYITGVI